MTFAYPLTGLVTLLTLAIYFWMAINVGKARAAHNVPAPKADGPDAFLRVVRVHENTMEGLLLYLPSLWLFALAFSDVWAALIGLLYPVGRIVYAVGYYGAAERRSTGFSIGLISTALLFLGAIVFLLLAASDLYL